MDTEGSGPSPEDMGLKADDMKVSGLEKSNKSQETGNSGNTNEKEKFSQTFRARNY